MEQGGARALCAGNRPARRHQWRHDLALALQGREPPLVLSARLPTSLRRPHLSSTLYQPCWEGHPLHDNDLVISAARRRPFRGRRTHASAPARPRRANARRTRMQTLRGLWDYFAALDVHRAHVVRRCGVPIPESRSSGAWSSGSWPPFPTGRPGASSGSSTTTPSHRARDPSNRRRPGAPGCGSSVPRAMPVDSIRSRSTSRSCNARP